MKNRAFGRPRSSGFGLPKFAFRGPNFLPEPKPKSLFEALRSKRFVRQVGLGLVLVMGSTFAAMQATATNTGADSVVDYSLVLGSGQFATRTDSTNSPHDLAGDLTFEAWVFPTSTPATGSILDKDTAYSLSMIDGTFQVAFSSSSGGTWAWRNTGVTAIANQWQHVAFTKQGNTGILYVNGVEVWSSTNSTWFPSSIEQNNNPLAIGSRINLVGRVDEVRVWATTRTPTQIFENMHRNHKSLTPVNNLRSYYDFNEDPGTSATYDRSVNVVHMTLSGSPTRVDVKEVSSSSTGGSYGETIVTFPRTYLPGVGGWTVPSATNFRALVVGGGGGGGAPADATGWSGGGGGAGGLKNTQGLSLSGIQTVRVGQGGVGGLGPGQRTPARAQTSGQGSALGSVSVSGGGRGGGNFIANAETGGSGGGGGMYGATGADGIAGEGNRGGNGAGHHSAGGGGGAGGAGGNGTSTSISDAVGGAGGAGVTLNISGTSRKYAWGGAGAGWAGYGTDWNTNTTNAAITPAANTGAGGGGGRNTPSFDNFAGWGASGVVIVRYTPTVDEAIDMPGNLANALTGPTDVVPDGTFTFEAWIYLRSNEVQTIFSQGVGHPSATYYLTTLQTGEFYTRWGADEASTGIQAPVNKWAHVALTRDSSGWARLFIDGVNVWTSPRASTTNPAVAAFRLGVQTGNGALLNGQIDQVKVWAVNLSDAELSQSMHAYGSTRSDGNPIRTGVSVRAHYDFNEFTANRIEPDRSGNGRNLTYGTAVSESSYTDSQIVEHATAHSLQTAIKFNRSYLTAAGGWTPPSGVSNFKALVVGAGGAGGSGNASNHGGGGGGGGRVLSIPSISITSTVAVRVGQGGVTPNAQGKRGSIGGETTLGSNIALGGGGGGGYSEAPTASWTGGGGAAVWTSGDPIGPRTGATPSAGRGFKGGDAFDMPAGGGGGSGGVGLNHNDGTSPARGGLGIQNSISGSQITYGSGGGGGTSLSSGAGGSTSGPGAGGGAGAAVGTAGATGTGAGGGGGSGAGGANWRMGGSGGSGVVVLSYGPALSIVAGTEPTVTRLAENFNTNIQVSVPGAGTTLPEQVVYVSAVVNATGAVATLRQGNSTTAVRQATTVNGVATFTGLGFPSGAAFGQHTLTFYTDPPSFIEATLTVTQSLPHTISIVDSGTNEGGSFNSSGVFVASASSVTILKSAIATALASNSVLIEGRSLSVSGTGSMNYLGTNSLTMRTIGGYDLNFGSAAGANIGTFSVGGKLTLAASNHLHLNLAADATLGGGTGVDLLSTVNQIKAGNSSATSYSTGRIVSTSGNIVVTADGIRLGGVVSATQGSVSFSAGSGGFESTASLSVGQDLNVTTTHSSGAISFFQGSAQVTRDILLQSSNLFSSLGPGGVGTTGAQLTAGRDLTITSSSALNIGSTLTVGRNSTISSGSGTVTFSQPVNATGNIFLRANSVAVNSPVSVGGSSVVTILAQTNSRVVNLGSEDAAQLSLVSEEVNRISASVLRIGVAGLTSGNINITAALSPTLSPTLALRTSASVSSSTNRSITIANLGVQAGGTISLAANNSVSGTLALNSPAATLTFNQTSGSFTPGTVDGITPEYGVPSSLTLSRVPTTAATDRNAGQDFDPSPVVTLRDEFGNLLTTSNGQSTNYSITVTRATGTGTVSGTLVRSTTAGVATFDNLRIIDGGGAHTLTFTATSASAPALIVGSPSATTGTYNIRVFLATPTAPTVAASTAALKRLDVSWSAVPNATSYVIKLYDSTGTGSALATVSVTSGTSRTLTTSDYASFADLTAYTVSVQAIGSSNFQDSAESDKATVRTRGLPQSITVDTAGVVDETGAWIGGTWYTATLGTSRVTPTVLQNQMSSASATLQTAGAITVSNAVASANASSSLSLISTGSNVTVNAAVSGVSGLTATCNSGSFTNSSSGSLTAAGAVSIQCGSVNTSGAISSGADITLESTNTLSSAVNRINGSVTSSASNALITLKAANNVQLRSVTIQTPGASSPELGGISIWADSDGNGVGNVYTSATCINTIGTCVAPVNTGGSRITVGGGSSADVSGRFPTGGPRSSDSGNGVRFGDGTEGAKLWSGGGQISITSVSSGTADFSGQYWSGGSFVHSGNGQITLTNIGDNSSSAATQSGVNFQTATSGENISPITLTSNRASGRAIEIISENKGTADFATGIRSYSSSTAVRVNLSAPAGGDIFLQGTTVGPHSIELNNTDVVASSGSITMRGTNSMYLDRFANSSVNIGATSSGSASGNILLEFGRQFWGGSGGTSTFKTTGGLTFRPFDSSFKFATHFPSTSQTLSSQISSLTVGSSTNTQTINIRTNVNIAGPITYRTGNLVFHSSVTSTSNSDIAFISTGSIIQDQSISSAGSLVMSGTSVRVGGTITASRGIDILSASVTVDRNVISSTAISVVTNRLNLGATLGTTSTSGIVTIAPQTNTTAINLGSEVSDQLSLTSAEVNRVSAGSLRIGALNGTNSGNINVTDAIAPTGVSTLALRTSGTVESSGSGSITEVNLAISASFINLGNNNSVTGNLALNSSGATLTYNQISGSFTPATVDQVTPEYGVATQITMSQVPTTSSVDRMMAVAFNPPPLATLKDKFGNDLTTANTQSTSYTVTATKAFGPGNLTGTTSTTTSTRGVARFNNLRISDSSGVHRITFTATVTATSTQLSGTPSFTTGDFNIKLDQTITFTSTAPTNARVSGAAYTPQASSSASLPVTITVDASATAVCSISGGVVSFLSVGTCVLNANQAGNSTYDPAPQEQQSFAVAEARLGTPQAPTVTATANTLKSLEVSWVAVTNAVSYTLKIYPAPGTGSESAIVVGITETSKRITASQFPQIADGTEYFVSVSGIASTTEGNSTESMKTSATTNSPAVAPTITSQPASASRTAGQSVTFTATANRTDAGVLSYQWRKDGSNIAGATSSTLTRNSLATGDAGNYSVVVTNSLNGTTNTTTSNAAVLTVASALVITTPSSGLAATVNSAYTLTLSASGGATPRTFATSSTLPTGVTLSSAGVLSGTPTQSGTFAITAVVTDSNGASVSSNSFSLVVAAAPGLVATFDTPVSAVSGQTDRLTVQITNYDPAYTWSGTASVGTVSVSNTGLVTFSGVSAGQTTSATITASRLHYLNATSNVSATMAAMPRISYNSSDLNSYATDSVVRDLSGRGNNGSAINEIGIVSTSGAWRFTGGTNANGDYIDLPDLATNSFSSGITVDFEADFGAITESERILDLGTVFGSVNNNLYIARKNNTSHLHAVITRSGAVFECLAENAIPNSGLNRWTVSFSGSVCVILRNSLEVARVSNPSFSLNSNQTLVSNFIGRSNNSSAVQFEGQIRSLRIFAGTPSFDQIGAFQYKTVSYNSNGGSAVAATARGTTSGELLLADAPNRTGFTFTGWYDSTNTLTRTKIGDAGARYAPSADIQLFAGWEATTLTVTFNSNSGTAVSSGTTRAGEDLAAPTSPTRVGYTFAGWFAQSDLSGTQITFPYAHGRDVNFTLYAKWTANAFDVTFVTNSGTAVTAFTTRTAESLPNSFTTTRAGYTFAGWFDNLGLTGSQIVFPYAHTNTSAFTLYAKWTANDLNVNFVTNSGTAVTAIVTRTGDSISSAPVAPTRVGYNFVGWFDNEGLSGSAITFPYAHGKTANFTLYAKWEAKTLTVSFNSSGGSSVSSITTQTAAVISSAPTPPTRAGYNFLGWVENGDLSGTVISFPYTHGRTADFTLYATWDANTLTVTFNSNSGVAVSSATTRTGDVISATVTTTRTGYAFAGWFDNEGLTGSAITFPYTHGKTANFTLFAKWTPNTLNVTFDTNSGTAVTATTTRTGEPLTGTFTTTRAGYTFAGWFDNVGLTGSQVSFPLTHGQTANFILYAKWTANTLNVRFERNDTSGNFLTGTTTTGGQVSPPATDPTYRGFEFLGWSETQNGSILTFPYLHGRTGDFTLHAVWKAGNYTVIYQYNGATGGNSTTRQSYTTDIVRTGLVLPVPTRTGFTFEGWFSDISLTTALVLENNGRYVPTANQTVYAKWEAIDYTVTYHSTDASSGSVPVDSRLYNIGQTVSLLSNSGLLARTGYTFAGWVISPTGQGTELNSGQTVTVGSTNVNFYPKWTAKTYAISYNLNGGTGSLSGAPTSWTVGTSNVTLPSSGFTRTGYNFGGWARTPGGSAVSNSFSNNFVDESLTAIWNLKSISYSFAPGAASSSGITRWPANSSANFGSELTLPDLAGEIVQIGGSSYLFFGWGDGSATYRSGQKYVLTESTPQFTAQWVKLLDVRYSFGGGTKAVSDTELNDGDAECVTNSLCTPNQEITLRGAPTRLGYSFLGWKAQTTSETIIRPAGTTTVIRNDNYLFFAEWVAVDYNFSFNSMGGSINNANVTGNIGRVLTLPSPGVRTGYTFGGWSPDLGATTYAAGPTYVVGSASIGFEAIWIPDVYQISFDWQGGVGTPQPTASFTVGRGAMVLPVQGDRVKDGFSFAGWSTTPGGEVVSNYEPTANGVLFAKWVDGNYTISFNAQNGPTPVTQALVARTTSTTLPTPTRSNFRLVGWFDALTGGNFVGAAGATYQPSASTTLYARWVQSSFYGVDEAALELASNYTASSSVGVDTTITHNPSGSQARIEIPAGTLPDGTVVSVRYFKDDTRQRDLIGNSNNYFFSVIVSWLLGSGATATVPDTLFANGVQKPITVTLTNSQIKAGAMVYQVLDGIVTPIQRATVDGSITVRIFSDPELVVAATPPTAPRNLLVVGPGRGTSTVSWLAPESNGGSVVTAYDVFLNGVLACPSVTVLSCDLTNLSDSNTYNVRVIAKNAVGNGAEATTSFTTSAPVTSSTGDGSGGGLGPVLPVKPVVPVLPVTPVVPENPVGPSPKPAPDQGTPTETPTAPPVPVKPVVPVEPKPDNNAAGRTPGSGDFSWLLWLIGSGLAAGVVFSMVVRARRLKR